VPPFPLHFHVVAFLTFTVQLLLYIPPGFNIQQFCILPTHYLNVLYVHQNKQLSFPSTTLTGWLL